MGLFTKLFSREGEGANAGQDDEAQPESGTNPEGAAGKPEDVVANTPDANDPRARNPASPNPEPARPAAAPAPSVVVTQSVALGKPPAAAAAATSNKGGAQPQRPGSPAKRDAAPAPKAPSALGSTQLGAAPGVPPLPDAAVSGGSGKKTGPNPQTSSQQTRNQQARKHTPAAQTRTNPTTVPLGSEVLVRRPSPAPPPLPGAQHAPPERAPLPLEAAVDAALAALTEPSRRSGADAARDLESDQRAVAATFAEIAKVHVEPLRELMFQISLGRTPGSWAAACRPVLRPLLDAATQIEMLELVGALGAFDASLERAAAEPTGFIGEAASDSLRAAYEHLRQQMPDAFTLPPRADNRRMIVLETLLLQIPALQRRTLEKLFAAGLSSLGQLSRAQPDEISAVAGIDRELAAAIVERVQAFERERSRIQPSVQRKHVQERLRGVIDRLSQLQTDFERAEQEASASRKRSARRGREAAVLELDLLFAELGEIDFIEELKRCPVRRKIQRVESYLEEQQASA